MEKRLFIGFAIAAAGTLCQAQSQPVYKCVTAGKVAYSDEPCIGAIVVDTTPTQGLDKISGVSKKGADVRAIEFNRTMAEALKPVFGETPGQRAQRHKRFKLSSSEQMECSNLDGLIPGRNGMDAREEVSLYQARKRHKDLKC